MPCADHVLHSRHRCHTGAPAVRCRLVHRQTLRELAATAAYQRKILMAAVQLVRPGGTLVFSTCSINPGAAEVVGGGWRL